MRDDNLPSDRPDTRGGKIEDWMATTGMFCLNTGMPTHHTKRHTPSSTGSAPDTSFVHPSLLDTLTWEVVNELGSDHMPIIISIPKVNDKPNYRWNLDKVDWDSYTKDVENNLGNTTPATVYTISRRSSER